MLFGWPIFNLIISLSHLLGGQYPLQNAFFHLSLLARSSFVPKVASICRFQISPASTCRLPFRSIITSICFHVLALSASLRPSLFSTFDSLHLLQIAVHVSDLNIIIHSPTLPINDIISSNSRNQKANSFFPKSSVLSK